MTLLFITRRFGTSTRKHNVFSSLFSHFQHGRKAKKAAQERGIDLNNLTAEQRVKLQPVLRLRSTFRVVNVVMGAMGITAATVWYLRRQRQMTAGKEINEEFQPVWMDLKYFKHKAALIHQYLLPEQIVGKLSAIKQFQFRADDCICASFPKSGTTLIQEIVFLIENNFDYSAATKRDISERFAFLEWPTVNLQKLNDEKRFFKTHLPPLFFNESFKKAKVVYACRNPKDVTVSLFHFLRSINIELTYSGPWNQFVRSFLIDEVYYAPWWRHVNDYHALNEHICFVTYEDLLTDFRGTVRRIAKYLGKEKELTEERLDQLQKWCSFESMKNNPKVNYNWFREWGFVNKSFSFLRKGEIGDWLNHFDVEQSKEYDQMVSTHLSPSIPPLNYGISPSDQQRLYDYDAEQRRNPFQMQKTEIHWSPNDRNELAEIGAEIIIHTFDRPLSGESGKCLLGGTNKKTTNLNYPLHGKNLIKCCAWWPSREYPYVFAIGQPNGTIIFENVKDRSDPLSQTRIMIDPKQGRACVALAWNAAHPNLLLSGFERSRGENCLTIWDVNHHGMASPTIPTAMSTLASNLDEYKRSDLLTSSPPACRAIFEHGLNEQCHSATWLRPNERVFAAVSTQHNTRMIRIYDPRAAASVTASFPTKAPFNLCADSSERYLASSVDKTVYVYDTRATEKALIVREEHEPIVKLSWSRTGASQLGYCIRDSPKFHVLSVTNQFLQKQDVDVFVHRVLQCPIQRYRIGLASFDWNYFDEHRLVLLSGKEYFDYVIPSRSAIDYSPRNGLLWTNGHEFYPSLISQDQSQLTSKVLFTYDVSNLHNDRRSLPASQPTLNTQLIQMDVRTMSKDMQSTIEQIQRWIKNASTTKDPYPFVGVIETLREAQPSATSTVSHQSWQTGTNSAYTKTVYESPERQLVSQLCGWSNTDAKSVGYDRMASLLEQDEFEKVAALYIFQMNINRAVEVLNEGLQRGAKEELAALILALLGSIRASPASGDDKNLLNDLFSATKLFHRPYVRAMFAFIHTSDGSDLQYECVLDEQLDLNDKVAFAARYLNDQRLYEKLDKLADESREKGNLQGILLTGLRQNGCELIQKYLDQTNDIRTAALLAIYVPEDVYQELPYVQEWIEGFRLLLDELQMWSERAEFDIYRSHVIGTTPHRRHLFDRSVNVNHHFSCIFCQTPLETYQGTSNQSSSMNANSTPIPTTPNKPQARASQQTMGTRSSGSSSSSYPPPPNSDLLMVCAKCRQVLPRCSICMMSLTTYIEDASYAYEPAPDKHTLMSSQWFTWCRLCRHGGHAEHVSNWFAMNEQCPIAKCFCRCTLIDGIFC